MHCVLQICMSTYLIGVKIPDSISMTIYYVIFFVIQQLSLKGFAGDTAKAHARTSMIAGEGVSNIRTVAAFNAQGKILSLFCH